MRAQKPHNRLMSAWYLGGCILGLVLIVTAIVSLEIRAQNQREIKFAVEHLAKDSVGNVLQRVALYEQGLNAIRGEVISTGWENLSEEKFLKFSESLGISTHFPGALGFGLVKMVHQNEEQAFLQSIRGESGGDFDIHQLSPHKGDHFVIRYVYPMEANSQAMGLDLASEAHRNKAAVTAMRTGKATLTAPITLVQLASQPGQSFLLLLPFYEGGVKPDSEQERTNQILGWCYVPIAIKDIVTSSRIDLTRIRLKITDITDTARPQTVFDDHRPVAAEQILHAQTMTAEVYGRKWQFDISALPEFAVGIHLTSVKSAVLIGLLCGLGYTLLAGIWVQSRQRFRQLLKTQQELEGVVESSIDGIIGKTLDGVVVSWNHGAELIFGFTAQEAIGRPFAELIVPQDLLDEERQILRTVASGGVISRLETRRKRKDGSIIDVSVAIAPIHNAAGEVIGISKTARDITQQKQVEAELIRLKDSLELEVAKRTDELEQARRTLKTVFDSLPTIIGYWDRDVINRVANRAYHEWFAIPVESMPGKSMVELFGEPFYETVKPYVDAVLQGSAQTFERELTTPEGKIRNTLVHYIPDIVNSHAEGFFVIVHDITELSENRTRLARALSQNTALLATINEQLFYSETDASGIILDVNDNFCRAHGYDRTELIGRTHRIVGSGIYAEAYWRQMWETISSGKGWHGDICNVTRDGRSLWFETVIAPVFDEEGRITRYIALRIDMTDHKNAESEIRRLNQMLRNVLSAASEVSIIAAGLDGMITVFNTGAERMLGYSEKEMVGKQTPLVLHQAEEMAIRAQEVRDRYGETVEGIGVFTFVPCRESAETREWTYVRKDGGILTVNLSVTAMRDEFGDISGYLGIAMDITEKRRQQLELAETKDQLELAAQIANMGVWSWEIGQDLLTWDRQMKLMYGLPEDFDPSAITYKFWLSRLHPDDVAGTELALKSSIESGTDFCPVFRVSHPDGIMQYMQAGAYIIRNRLQRATKVIGICLDVTDRMQSLEYMTQAKIQAEQASVAKGQFLANMSHEIRTPMNAVLGMLQLIKRTELTARQYDYADKAQIAARSLLGLLNDILDFSKIEAGKLQLDIHPFGLEGMLRDLAVVLSGNVGERDIELLFDIDPRVPALLDGDRMRIQQVLINLAGNAIKFTSRGQVVVSIRAQSIEYSVTRLHFSVSDTGIGISAEQISKIFEGFSQAESSTTRRYGGTGLGLSISKRLVDIMGGTLQVSSELGKGSRFYFEIPLGFHPSDNTRIQDKPNEPCRVLVVDDNPYSLDLINAALRARDWQPEATPRGEEAIAMAAEAQRQGQPYKVAVIDLRMPAPDGLDVATTLQAMDPAPAIVMVSAFGAEELSEILASGNAPFATYLSKPHTPGQLYEAIERALGICPLPSPPSLRDAQGEPALLGMKILVVEDNVLNRKVADELLSAEGAIVTLAEGGLEGVAAATSETGDYDVVVMDVQMPDLDGLEATRRIRRHPRGQVYPIVAMTANVSLSDQAACLAAGMDEHVGKPLDMEELIPVLLRATSRLDAATGIRVPDTDENAGQVGEDRLLEPVQGILGRFRQNMGTFAEILGMLEAETLRLLSRARSALDSGNLANLELQLHSLKGMAAMAGAERMAKVLKDLEHQVRQQPQEVSVTDFLARFGELEDLAHTSVVALREQMRGMLPPPAPAVLAPVSTIPDTPDPAAWQQRLTLLKGKLQRGDASACDVVGTLAGVCPAGLQIFAQRLTTLVERFEFEQALHVIAELEESDRDALS